MKVEKGEIIRPNFFIVGAARSGTTSLSRYLSQHPAVYIPRQKEIHFFAADYFPRNGPGDEWLNKVVIHDEVRYTKLFAGVKGEKAVGEASVFYLCLPGTAERIAQAVPDAKIVMVLREPVDRAYSAYMHLVRLRLEEVRREKGFEPLWWYKELSLYYKQVKQYLDVFGVERVKVVLYDDLCTNPEQVVRDVFVFLGVREDVPIDTSARYNIAGVPKSRRLYTLLDNFIKSSSPLGKGVKSLVPMRLGEAWHNKAMAMFLRSVPMDSQVHAQLKEYFAEDIAKLQDLLCREISCWGYRVQSIVQV
jgi:hypothetical protein